MNTDLWVVVPFHNESGWIGGTVAALAAQQDTDFCVVFVDNGSTDASPAELRAALALCPELRATVLDEPEKGVGAAADTGFRLAIATGARWIARTDADCLPAPDWTARVRHAMDARGLELMSGKVRARTDDTGTPLRTRALAAFTHELIRFAAPRLRTNEGPGSRFVMTPGGNMAIAAATYLACDGYPRASFDGESSDKALVNRVRQVSARLGYEPRALVRHSTRRVQHYGLRGTLRWYRDHVVPPRQVIDVR